jgi:hypothetical protein|tara:strand:+ start:2828 stop:3088 length:261 start_codon:yes stop_codon:yes gene_type:complete
MYYKQNYENIIKALQVDPNAAKKTLMESEKVKGLGRPLNTNKDESDVDKTSIAKRMLEKMDEVQKQNMNMLDRTASMDMDEDRSFE